MEMTLDQAKKLYTGDGDLEVFKCAWQASNLSDVVSELSAQIRTTRDRVASNYNLEFTEAKHLGDKCDTDYFSEYLNCLNILDTLVNTVNTLQATTSGFLDVAKTRKNTYRLKANQVLEAITK